LLLSLLFVSALSLLGRLSRLGPLPFFATGLSLLLLLFSAESGFAGYAFTSTSSSLSIGKVAGPN